MKPPVILIAASGTGGHLIPALVLAEEFSRRFEAKVHFVGSGRTLEVELIGLHGYPLARIDVTGISGLGVVGMLRFLIRLPRALWQTCNLMNTLRPDLVVGIGGYASVLPVFVAWCKGVPTLIHEAELHLGLANKVLARVATRISLAHAGTVVPYPSRAEFCGQPTRSSVLKLSTGSFLDKKITPENILILGGSQGSQFIDEQIPELSAIFKSKNVNIWHQARGTNVEQVRKRYAALGVTARVTAFIRDIHEAYAWSDLIISRSGAGSVTEIAQTGRPAIFIPFPSAADNHQVTNALPMVQSGRALIVEESENFLLHMESALVSALNPASWRKMGASAFTLDTSQAAAKIVDLGIGLIAAKNKA
jgi:UDP-N-acetylglucosamine--N-acetylmuramyl-(pentapeptide) pyrophosphoryl-undecaprenol N-acetylglucosamine transferase